MRYVLLIVKAPASSAELPLGVRFLRAAKARGDEVPLVFFHAEGAWQANGQSVVAQDQQSAAQRWATETADGTTELRVCVGSALRAGLLDPHEAARRGSAASSLHPDFALGGLGDFLEQALQSDRIVTLAG